MVLQEHAWSKAYLELWKAEEVTLRAESVMVGHLWFHICHINKTYSWSQCSFSHVYTVNIILFHTFQNDLHSNRHLGTWPPLRLDGRRSIILFLHHEWWKMKLIWAEVQGTNRFTCLPPGSVVSSAYFVSFSLCWICTHWRWEGWLTASLHWMASYGFNWTWTGAVGNAVCVCKCVNRYA